MPHNNQPQDPCFAVDRLIDRPSKRLANPTLSDRAFAIFFVVTILIAVTLLLAPKAHAVNDLYWDTNGTSTGSGAATGAWGTSNFWSNSSAGTGSTFTTSTGNTNDLHFSAGTNGTGGTVTVSGAQSANSIIFEEGAITLSGGTSITLGGGGGVNSGLIFNSTTGLNTISTALILGSAAAFTNNDNSLQTISGGVTGAFALTLNGSGTGGLTLSSGSINNGGTITNSGSGTGTTTISSVIGTNVTGVTENSSTSTLVLSGANTYTTATNVTAGVLNIRNNTALGTTATGTIVSSGAALQLQGGIAVGNEALTLDGAGIGASGALRNISEDNSWAGTITINSTTRINSDSGTLTLDVTSGNAITGSNDALQFGGAGDVTVNDAIATGTGTLTKDGAGALTLSGANTYTGATTVSAGVLNIQNNTALGTTAGGATVSSGAALELQGGIAVGAESLSLNGTGISSGGGLRNISGDNSWSGTITLADVAGAHRINSDSGTLTLEAIGETGNTTKTLTVGGAGNVVVNGIISGGSDMGVAKDGAGTLTLTEANTYNNGTTVTGGTLLVSNTTGTSGTGSGSVTVNGSGTTLGGTGTITGSVTLGNTTPGAILNPGPKGANATAASVGTLTTGALTLTGSNVFHIDAFGTAAGNWDKLIATAGVTLGTTSTLELSIASGLTFTNGTQYTLIEKTSGGNISGTFSNAADGSTITANGYLFMVDYTAGTGGNDLVLTCVPEPSTWIGGALAFAAIGFTQLRKRSRAGGQRIARLVRRTA
jgi:fibronectin-binding autotransporter adhesin